MDTQYSISGNYSRLVNPRLLKVEGHLIFETDIHIDGDMIDRNQRLEVIPVLLWEADRLELPLVLVNGRKRHRAYLQMCATMGQESIEKAYRIYQAMSAGKNLACHYRQEIPYSAWMEHALVQVHEE